ncbi:MAG: aminopeptidase [Jatrophihabitans sp.]|uniref:aminopeptidase n=1 Tax=Jatrophihabitans sp. TaxID=1932789 RepID=UPI003F7E9814
MTEPYDHLLEAYARLVVRVGVNVQVGQRVVIMALPEQAPVARALAEEAYRVGASHVSIDYDFDPYVQRAQVKYAPDDQLGRVLDHQVEGIRAMSDDRPAVIRLTGNPHPSLMDGLDPARLAKSAPLAAMAALRDRLITNEVAWTVVGAPTPGWAESILGTPDTARLWDAVAVAMRLDEDDPVQAWRDHIARLHQRRDILNARGFDRVRYRGPGTDLTVGVSPESSWVAGAMTNDAGVDFVANMPTEEVFFSPDWRRAEGRVRTTAPFYLISMGTLVEGLELELHDGAIVGASAERGEHEVQQQFEVIPRSRHLGEIAIVDGSSRVARTGLTFKDMLFDENIGSHIAWGAGFAFAWNDGVRMTAEQRIASGLNQSNTHVDIVVGSPEVEIDGIAADGTVVPITRGDAFVLTDA